MQEFHDIKDTRQPSHISAAGVGRALGDTTLLKKPEAKATFGKICGKTLHNLV